MSTETENNPLWILVVEDDPEICGLLAEGLAKAGYKVVQATQVAEANAKIAQQRFDCIVTDLYLGKGDGGLVIKGIRYNGTANAESPILLMSARLEMDRLQELRPLVNGVLVKPFGLAALLDRLQSLVGTPAPLIKVA